MKGKKPLTLAEMANRSANSNGRMECLKCGCRDFRADLTRQGVAVTFRYRVCRNCGTKFFTEQPPEKILRVVEPRKKSDEPWSDQLDSESEIV